MSASAQLPYRPGWSLPSLKRLWWTAFLTAGALYLLTAQRGPAWQDSGTFQWRMHSLDLTGHLGLALAHPLLIVLGKLAGMVPLGAEAWRFNAVSAVAGAVATANLIALVRRLAPKVPAAAYFAGGAFALAHTVWWLATIAESHMLLAALMSGELLVLASLLHRPRISMVLLLGLLNGLGLSTHNLALLALPAYGLAVVILAARRRLRWWCVPLFILAWSAGASVLLTLMFRLAGEVGFWAAAHSALFGHSWRGSVLGGSLRAAGFGIGYVAYNLPNLALPLAAVGLWRLGRRAGRPLAAAMAYILAVHFIFAIRYTVPDQFMFFVPFYLMVSLLAGLGLAHLCSEGRRWLKAAAILSLLLGPIAYAVGPPLVRALGVSLPGGRRTIPFRDHARYWLTPWKMNEDSAERFAREAMRQLDQHTGGPVILFADGTTYWPLRWLVQVEHAGPELRLVGGPEQDLLKEIQRDPERFWKRTREERLAIFATSNRPLYCPAVLLPYVEAEPTGVLYRVNPPARQAAAMSPRGRPRRPNEANGAARG